MRTKPLVLIVDDEDSFLEIFSLKLQAAGLDTAEARNETEAIVQAEKLMPDLVLMDINMPGGTGTDAALAIRQKEKTRGIKIAFLTNVENPWPTVSDNTKKLSRELGMEDFIEKTEGLDSIVEKAKQILARK